MDHEVTTSVACHRHRKGEWEQIDDTIGREVRVVVDAGSNGTAELWACPLELEDLVLGHALIEMNPGWLSPALLEEENGVFTLQFDQPLPSPRESNLSTLAPDEILRAMELFMQTRGYWDGTGCFHRAAAYDPAAGQFVLMAEDIGRHNCVDRLAGKALVRGMDAATLVCFVSARITGSLAAKIVRAGFTVAVSRSAVTTAALTMARESGLTLVGFSREGRFTVFCDPGGRIAQ